MVTASYSAMTELELCPKKFYETRIAKSIPYEQNVAAASGDFIHKELETAINTGIVPTYLGKFSRVINKLRQFKYSTENKLSIDKDGNRTYSYKDSYMTTIPDVLILLENRTLVLDWKFGKSQSDKDVQSYGDKTRLQAEMLIYNTEAIYGKPTDVKFIYPIERSVGGAKILTYISEDIDKKAVEQKVVDFYNFQHVGNYPPKKNGLCKAYCPVVTCKYNGRYDGF